MLVDAAYLLQARVKGLEHDPAVNATIAIDALASDGLGLTGHALERIVRAQLVWPCFVATVGAALAADIDSSCIVDHSKPPTSAQLAHRPHRHRHLRRNRCVVVAQRAPPHTILADSARL